MLKKSNPKNTILEKKTIFVETTLLQNVEKYINVPPAAILFKIRSNKSPPAKYSITTYIVSGSWKQARRLNNAKTVLVVIMEAQHQNIQLNNSKKLLLGYRDPSFVIMWSLLFPYLTMWG